MEYLHLVGEAAAFLEKLLMELFRWLIVKLLHVGTLCIVSPLHGTVCKELNLRSAFSHLAAMEDVHQDLRMLGPSLGEVRRKVAICKGFGALQEASNFFC